MIGQKELMQKLVSLWGEVRNQKYKVYRSGVNWPNHDFTKFPYAVAVGMDEYSFLSQINEGILSFEIFAKITNNEEIDDAEFDVQSDNVLQVLSSLEKSTNEDGDFIASVLPNTGRIVEHYDSAMQVQGLIVMVTVKF
jgi:hypothetical protein